MIPNPLPKRATVQQLSEWLERSDETIRGMIREAGLKRDSNRRYLVLPIMEAYADRQTRNRKSGATLGAGELRAPTNWADQKRAKDVERLEVIIARERGELVAIADVQADARRRVSLLQGAVESWRAHETAKTPRDRALIDGLTDRFLKALDNAMED